MYDPSIRSLQITTIINFAETISKKLNSCVYLYDPSWMATSYRDDIDTLCFAYVEVIKEEIIQNCSVSKKRIILYNPNKALAEGVNPNPGVVNIAIDNIVNEPVIHKLECLVPKEAVFKTFTDVSGYASTAITAISGANYSRDTASMIGGTLNFLLEAVRGILTGFNALMDIINKTSQLITMYSGKDSDYIKKTLLSMARRRAILKYKPWSTWETRDVVITGIQFSKQGIDGDYYRASIELQEMPILSIGPLPPATPVQVLSASDALLGNAIKAAFRAVTGTFEKGILGKKG